MKKQQTKCNLPVLTANQKLGDKIENFDNKIQQKCYLKKKKKKINSYFKNKKSHSINSPSLFLFTFKKFPYFFFCTPNSEIYPKLSD